MPAGTGALEAIRESFVVLLPLKDPPFLLAISPSIWLPSSSLSDLTFWRNFRLSKSHKSEYSFNYSLRSVWIFQFLTHFLLSPTGC
jgi:hypothetical protein